MQETKHHVYINIYTTSNKTIYNYAKKSPLHYWWPND